MKPCPISVAMTVVSLFFAPTLVAQSPDAANQNTVSPAPSASAAEVPRLIKFSGTLLDAQERPMAGPVGVTFALYSQQDGGAALWMETQNVKPDANGVYSVLLGANSANGVPAELFASAEARWLEVQVERQAEQPRVLLVSVPYALKAKDAETLGGKPASAFVTTETLTGTSNSAGAAAASTPSTASTALPISKTQTTAKKAASTPQPATACTSVTSDGTAAVNSIATFTTACNIESSVITQSGTNVGIGTAAPAVALDVLGNNAGLRLSGTGTHQVTVTGATSGRLGQDSSGFFFASDTNGKTVRFLTNNGTLNEWMRITSAGNVGVGTAAPAAKLDVNGNVNGTTGNSSSGSAAVSGNETATTGQVFGVSGGTSSTTEGSAGVSGNEGATTGHVYGVFGSANSTTTNAMGVSGYEAAATGQVYGVDGYTTSTGPFAAGVGGFEGATTGQVFGVAGGSSSSTQGAAGVSGFESATTGQVFGVTGGTNSTTNGAAAVNGFEGATTGQVFGVTGGTNSTTNGSAGVSGNAGATSGAVAGVFGSTSSTSTNAMGVSGFEGATTGQVYGVNGNTNSTGPFAAGVNGFEGATTGQVFGVSGSTPSTSGTGVSGNATASSGSTNGVSGFSASPNGNGVLGGNNATSGFAVGVTGFSASPTGAGVNGFSSAASGGIGVNGNAPTNGTAVQGANQVCTNSGCTPVAGTAGSFQTGAGGTILRGTSGSSFTTEFLVDASGNGFFGGNLSVTGNLTKGSGSFKIDHPLDPANRYLSHSFVESPDMMNVYDGVVVLDAHGCAWVTLPDYFEALNRDFRYQLTAIGTPGPNLYVAKKVADNRFKIAGGKPHGEVSWQVTGVRHDAYADAHRIAVDEEKPTAERGFYLYPDAYGLPQEKSVARARTHETKPKSDEANREMATPTRNK